MVIGADFNGHVGEGNRYGEDVLERYGDKARQAEGHTNLYGGGFRDKNGNGYGKHVFQEEGGAHCDYNIGGRSTRYLVFDMLKYALLIFNEHSPKLGLHINWSKTTLQSFSP